MVVQRLDWNVYGANSSLVSTCVGLSHVLYICHSRKRNLPLPFLPLCDFIPLSLQRCTHTQARTVLCCPNYSSDSSVLFYFVSFVCMSTFDATTTGNCALFFHCIVNVSAWQSLCLQYTVEHLGLQCMFIRCTNLLHNTRQRRYTCRRRSVVIYAVSVTPCRGAVRFRDQCAQQWCSFTRRAVAEGGSSGGDISCFWRQCSTRTHVERWRVFLLFLSFFLSLSQSVQQSVFASVSVLPSLI